MIIQRPTMSAALSVGGSATTMTDPAIETVRLKRPGIERMLARRERTTRIKTPRTSKPPMARPRREVTFWSKPKEETIEVLNAVKPPYQKTRQH